MIGEEEIEIETPISSRIFWLIGLLIIQSFSSFILTIFDEILKKHFIIAIFLTMMLGTGGNVSSQSCLIFVKGLAKGTIDKSNLNAFFFKEQKNGIILGLVLGFSGFIRIYLYQIFYPSKNFWMEAFVIVISLFWLVYFSSLMGSLLPLIFYKVGIDPTHSGPTIQVLMDMIGVSLICLISYLFLR